MINGQFSSSTLECVGVFTVDGNQECDAFDSFIFDAPSSGGSCSVYGLVLGVTSLRFAFSATTLVSP